MFNFAKIFVAICTEQQVDGFIVDFYFAFQKIVNHFSNDSSAVWKSHLNRWLVLSRQFLLNESAHTCFSWAVEALKYDELSSR